MPYFRQNPPDWPDGRDGSTVQPWRGIFGSHGATFSNNYRNRLVDWFLENPRPDYAIAPNQPACIGDLNDDGDPKLEERIKNDLAVTVRLHPPRRPETLRRPRPSRDVPVHR